MPRAQALLAATWMAAMASPGEAASAAEGLAFARTHCQRCHVVEPASPFAGIGSTPSFALLMSLPDGADRFATFFARRPHPALVRMAGVEPPTPLPPSAAAIEMTAEQLDDLLAYVRGLAKTP